MNVKIYPRTVYILLCALLMSMSAEGQQVRSYDGYGNNEANPELGATQTPLKVITSLEFEDKIGVPTGSTRPNPREISNRLFAQDELIYDEQELSDFVWVFGQFIDHDIVLVGAGDEPAMIVVPPCDPVFDPNCETPTIIPMTRSKFMVGTGLTPENPRQYANEITPFIDGSGVYGSSEERANWLRTFEDGKLKTSQGNLLPFNTMNGELSGATDEVAPHMEISEFQDMRRWFVAGDARANENVLLTAMHTLFVREHNRLCDDLKLEYPNADDEQLFQKARTMIGGMIQSITYNQWLPAMGVEMDGYSGYRSEVDPRVSNVFSAAAFRFGHTLLSTDILRMKDDCNTMPDGNMNLLDGFFNPEVVLNGIDPLVKGMSAQIQQSLDCKVIDDVRNFLFGPPGYGVGMDLAAININRGRERGLPDYNAIRGSVGLPSVRSFNESFSSHTDAQALEDLYGDINSIDPWVGLLAEVHVPGALFGETIMAIIKKQFQEIRDGDRFFFEADPSISATEVEMIRNSTLADIIRRNTKIEAMQENVFKMERTCRNVDIEEKELELAVYPNPIKEDFDLTVYSFTGGDAELRIFDALGKVVYSNQLSLESGVNTFFVPLEGGLSQGLYHLDVSTSRERNSTKLYLTD